MTRGVPLTPEQTTTILQAWEETGNASEGARRAGCSADAAQRAVDKSEERKRAELHAAARTRGIDNARRRLGRASKLADHILHVETAAGVSLEPKDIAALIGALVRSSEALVTIDERYDRRAQARLTRDKTRAETELLRKKINGEHVDRVAFEGVSDDELDRRIAERVRSEAADQSPTD